jgi:flagellar basal body rod protein FlgC
MSAASDALSKIAVVSDAASNAQSKITARSTTWDAKVVILKVYNEASAIAAGDGKMYFTIPAVLNGMNLTSVGGHLYTAATSAVVQVQIANVTSGVDMLSAARLLEWDVTEKDTATAAASSVVKIPTANDGVATGEELRIDIDAAASGAKGMEVRLTFRTP